MSYKENIKGLENEFNLKFTESKSKQLEKVLKRKEREKGVNNEKN